MSAGKERISRLALLLVAANVVFRAFAVAEARFTGDESWFWATARNIATFNAAPVYGPSLTGSGANHPGPLFFYLMALPQFLGSSPYLGGIFVALLHGFAAFLFYLLAKRARGHRAGMIALLLLLFAPWDVLYADRIWLSCVAPVWGTASIYAAVRATESARWQGVLVFLLLVCPQLHMSAPIIWLFAAVVLVLMRPERFSKRAIAVGFAAAVLAYLPAIYWELTHGFVNTLAILREGKGTEPPELHLAPLRVFGYGLLYATSEIGYHFARGYWMRFSELNQYGSAAGWGSWFATHGIIWGVANLVSIAVALFGWTLSVRDLVKKVRAARREKKRLGQALGVGGVLTLALLASLLGALALLVMMQKLYFPHYTNLLMPVILWPVVQGADMLLEDRRPRLRAAVGGALAVSMAAMASSTIRYYSTVDALNGLDATLGMTEVVMKDAAPVRLEFEGFHNEFAWRMLADVKYRRPLVTRADAPIVYRVKNAQPYHGQATPDARVFGIVRLERTPPFSP